MTAAQSWDVIYSVLLIFYVFGFTPLIGVMLGGNYSDYGKDNKYENCMGRGLIAHVVAGIIIFIFVAAFRIVGRIILDI